MLNRLFPAASRHINLPLTVGVPAEADRWVGLLLAQRLQAEARGRQVGRTSDGQIDGLLDIRLAGPGDPKDPDEAFRRLRWGGVFACIDPSFERVEHIMEAFDGKNGFTIERPIDELWGGTMGFRIPRITPRAFYFLARKTELVAPGEIAQHHSYDVSLVLDSEVEHGFRVCKKVPSIADTAGRLRGLHPQLDRDEAQLRAMRLVNDVFPIFLTREAKMLQMVQKALPAPFRSRVPRLLGVKKNDQGFVTRLDMNWLRNGGRPISHLEYARQAAELLSVLHDHARIMHLDLRPDNLVITPEGLGFIDFGTAARVDEDLLGNAVLGPLFRDVMQTSQIQRSLGAMLEKGLMTNQALAAAYGRPDTRVDTFQLAVLINRPHANPEFEQLVRYNPLESTAAQLERLTASILRPRIPCASGCKTAADILRGIDRIGSRAA